MPDFTSLLQGLSRRDIGYIIKGIIQKSINSELTNADISNSDNKTPVLITNSKDVTLLNDIPIQTSIEVNQNSEFYMPEEADGKDLRIWTKFENAGQLRDYSLKKNQSYSVGATNMPGLFAKYVEDSQMKYEMFSYFNGINQFAYVKDNTELRLTNMITDSKKLSVFMRMLPVSLAVVSNSQFNSLFSKVDDDQLRYGYAATVDMKGNIHFYVRHDYRQYHLMVKDAYANILTDPIYNNPGANFRYEDFTRFNFITNYQRLCNLIDANLPFDDYIFSYVPTTKRMYVTKTNSLSTSAVVADTTTISPLPIINLPIQDGKWKHDGTVQTIIHDASGNGHNGTINNIAIGGQWNQDNTLLNNGGNAGGTGGAIDITLPSGISAVNTATEFTIAFWFNPGDIPINPNNYYEYFTWKENNQAGDFWIERKPLSGSMDFSIKPTTGGFQTVTFPNAIINSNTWYFIVCKWKSGEKLKISINNSANVESTNNIVVTTPNNTGSFKIFYQSRSPKGRIALFKYYNIQISQTVQDELYYEGYHNPLFPRSENVQQVWDDTPDPILIPYTTAYLLDKMTSPVEADYVKLNSPSSASPFVPIYNVADETSTSDPEVLRYDVPDGVVTGGGEIPFSRIGAAPATIDSSDNSSGKVGAGQNEAFALQLFSVSSGIGQTINGKVITKAIFWMRRPVASVTGTLYCRIWNTGASLTPVATIGQMAASAVTEGSSGSDWLPYTFTNTANTVAMASGFRIGIEYQGYGGDDVIDIQRKGSPSDLSAYQTTYDNNWDSDGNNAFSVKCDLYTGGTGSPSVNPWYELGSGGITTVTESFGSTTHNLLNRIPTKITLRLKKTGTPSGTFTVNMMNSSGTPIANSTFSGPNTANSLTTDFADYTFTLLTNTNSITNTVQIAVSYGGTGGKVCVNTNRGNTTAANAINTGGTNNYHSSTSYLRRYQGSFTNEPTIDLSAKIYTGGTSFDAFKRFSSSDIRITTKIVNNTSSINNKKITRLLPRMKKVGSPTGVITATIRDNLDNIKVQYSSVDVSTIPSNGLYNDVEFLNVTHNYFTNNGGTSSGDKVSYEYSGSDGSNYIELNANKDVLDTLNTISQSYNGNYIDDAQHDLAGKLYQGGEPDTVSRTRVAQSIEHQNSRLKGKRITRVSAFLYRTNTSTLGTVYCNIRRGSDDALLVTIEQKAASTLGTTPGTPTVVTFTNTANSYALGVGDKITIEYSDSLTSSVTNQVGVLIRTVTPDYDTVGTVNCSFIRKYDEIDYDDMVNTKDLCATMEEGGYMYTPAAGEQPDPTPVNDKDLIILAGNNKLSGFLECLLKEFRIYSKELTLTQATSLHHNRYSISPITKGEILMPFTFRMVPDV